MRTSMILPLVLFVALALTGCSVASGAFGSPAVNGPSSSSVPSGTPSTSTPPPALVTSPGPTAAASPAATSPSPAAGTTDPATAAIQAVIQKANQEQQDAFAKNDPTVMKDTATSAYYDQLVQINSDMSNGGVSSIKLVTIEWGQIKVTSPTTAQATTFETWQTVYSDGSTDQSRQQNVYALVQEQGVWKIQSDDNPNSTPSPSGGSSASASSGSGVPSSPSTSVPPAPSAAASQTDVSRNWSGYAATSGAFTAVTGTWTVPQSQSAGNLASGATWVGIGGVNSKDLIQAGTQEMTNGSGAVQYEAWIETLPKSSRPVPFAVSPGDSVTVSISQQGTGQWQIDFKNHTTGESYQTNVQYASSLSSAEWVEEAPSVGRRVVPIDNFGTIQFSGGSAVENGKSVTIAQAGAQPITLTGAGGSALATPSVLTSDGQGFSVSRSAAAPAPRPAAAPRSNRGGS